jgi:hypothetical protein
MISCFIVKVSTNCLFLYYKLNIFSIGGVLVGGSFGPSFILTEITLIMFSYLKTCSAWEPLTSIHFRLWLFLKYKLWEAC